MTDFRHGLLIHPRTNAQIELFLRDPSHALLLSGETGGGKYTLAKVIASNLLGLEEHSRLSVYPHYYELKVSEGKQDISIGEVRELTQKLKLKVPGTTELKKLVVIEGAQNLSHEAQNALLKSLEEPPLDTIFILTAPYTDSLAPTIISRTQKISVLPVTHSSAIEYYSRRYSEDIIRSNWALSGGGVGLLDSLLKEDDTHPLKRATDQFKQFLNSDTYNRLLITDTLSRDKTSIRYFLEGGKKVLKVLHHNSIKNGRDKQAIILAGDRNLVTFLTAKLDSNANARLVALSLALNLKL